MALGASRARGAFLTISPATPGQDLTGGQAYAIVAISAGGPCNAAIRRAPPMFHRNQGRPLFVVQPDTEHAKGESPCWLREDWLHWDSLAQWPLEHQRRVWLKVCT